MTFGIGIQHSIQLSYGCLCALLAEGGTRFNGKLSGVNHRFFEALTVSNYLFFRISGRKTGAHFSWKCSSAN